MNWTPTQKKTRIMHLAGDLYFPFETELSVFYAHVVLVLFLEQMLLLYLSRLHGMSNYMNKP